MKMKIQTLGLCAAVVTMLTGAAPALPAQNPVHMNQLGFRPSDAKRAMIADPSPAPLAWKLVDAKRQVQASGRTTVFGDDAASGEHVHAIDFSSIRQPGTDYRLIVGSSESRPFKIDDAVYSRLKFDALEYFYHNRAGTPIEARFVGQQWARPAGHPHEVIGCFAGTGTRANVWKGCDYKLDVTGGWYDAGDQGKYVVNGGIAVWTLMNLYERQKQLGKAAFADGSHRIPEAGNRVNDLLDEARWEMEFLLRMQVPDGKRAFVPVGIKSSQPNMTMTEIDASGMAHHKEADLHWTKLPTAPDKDPETRVLYPPSTGATLNLAATAAQCTRIWRGIDPAFSSRCLAASERAYQAALRNPEVYAAGDFTGSGGYGDNDLSDEFYWAAAELFITTGKPLYRDALTRSSWFKANPAPDFSWSHTPTLGTISLAVVPNLLPGADRKALRESLVSAADRYLQDETKVGYRIPYAPPGYPWGSNSSVLNRAIVLGLAHDFTRQAKYRDGVVDAMDYVLGRNPLDQSYVSGYGARPMQNPHHRFWTHALDPSFPPPPPGALSGGPNSTMLAPELRKTLGNCAPQTCWHDVTMDAPLNEVAINWNAPLVWVAAFMDERR